MIDLEIKYKSYEKFGNILVKNILDKLTGVHKDFDRINLHELPSNEILIGTLGGVNAQDEKNDSPFLNSMSVKFLLEEFKSEISLELEFYLFYRVYPTYKEQLNQSKKDESEQMYFSRIWKKKKVSETVICNNESKIISLSPIIAKAIDEIKIDEDVLRKDVLFKKESSLSSEESYNAFISKEKRKEFPDFLWDIKLVLQNTIFVQDDAELVMVDISLVNNTLIPAKEDRKNDPVLFDPAIFNPTFKVHLNDNSFKKFSYKYDTDKIHQSDSRPLNCQGEYDCETNSIETKNYGIFNQRKFVPKNKLEGVDLSFKTLSSSQGIAELEKIYSEMNLFYDDSSITDESYEDFYDMKERFNKNISFLKENDDVAEAFYLMNETFCRNSQDSSYDSWRLFQIVFIVSLLSDIVLKEERDTCELLHVMTGGGKSESYFGLVVFTAFYDRLSGKEFGVSAITKFPLRMLSVQQLQRISDIFIFAEQVRLDHGIKGHPFSIAYFVGSQDDFPDHNIEFLLKIRKAKENNENIKGHIIDKCPLCGGDVFLDIEDERQLVIHRCESCNEIFRLYFSDDEIYRTLPTFIVSTVDKWAGIALNRRFRNLLGGELDLCPKGHGFIPRNDTCGFYINTDGKECKEKGERFNKNFDTSPTLIIQDEMHLIKEGFGTIDSHFESLIETIRSENSEGTKFKNIVMTATVSGADKQIMHLYHKETRLFPPELKDENGDTFFFEYLKDENGENLIQRQIIGLKSSIQNFKLIFHIMKYVSQFFLDLESNLIEFSETKEFELEELKIILNYYKKLLTYHNKKEAVHSISYSVDDYVNIYEDTLYKVLTEPLTGESSLEDIKNIIYNVKHFYDDEANNDKLFVVNSTNIVSHGVDIDEWNLMIFDGMPRSTSEYIQALSRVGRKFFGIVFVSFSPMRTRDLSFYQHFNEYHDMLDYKVEDVPLSRWAKLGFKQTFTSVFNAAILNYLSNELNIPLYRTVAVLNVLNKEENKVKLIDFIKKSYISDSPMSGSEFFDESIETEVELRIQQLKDYPDVKFFPNALKKSPNKYFDTQFGMRGIQDEILLTPHQSDDHFRTVYRG